MKIARPLACLFDLDGTMADTFPDLAGTVNRLRSQYNLAAIDEQMLRSQVSAGVAGLIATGFCIDAKDDRFESLKQQYLALYAQHLTERTGLFDGMEQALAMLDHAGIAWGIVTNKAARFAEPIASALGLDRAACLVCGDTTPYSKPHPAPLLEAARRLNVEPAACWYVGDDLRDIEAGRASGMTTVAALWGYGTGPQEWRADLYASTPRAVRHLIGESAS